MTETRGRAARPSGSRRAPHPAQGARIAAAGFGTAATLALVGAMSLAAARNDASTPQSAPGAVVLPGVAAAPSTTVTTLPTLLSAEPSPRVVPVTPSPAPQRLRANATTSGSR